MYWQSNTVRWKYQSRGLTAGQVKQTREKCLSLYYCSLTYSPLSVSLWRWVDYYWKSVSDTRCLINRVDVCLCPILVWFILSKNFLFASCIFALFAEVLHECHSVCEKQRSNLTLVVEFHWLFFDHGSGHFLLDCYQCLTGICVNSSWRRWSCCWYHWESAVIWACQIHSCYLSC